jgi:uncharacterized protein with FMN-binding domain
VSGMRRITLWLVGTVCGLVLLFSYRTSTMGAAHDPAHAAAPPGIVNPPAGAPPAPGPAATGAPNGDTVVNGSVAQTRWGPVQVQVRISGGRIVDVTALQVPNGNRRDQEINSYAVPQLRSEVLATQSAHIDTVSGATVTSDGYRESLQAALDAAHFGS